MSWVKLFRWWDFHVVFVCFAFPEGKDQNSERVDIAEFDEVKRQIPKTGRRLPDNLTAESRCGNVMKLPK